MTEPKPFDETPRLGWKPAPYDAVNARPGPAAPGVAAPHATVLDTVKDALTIISGAAIICYALGFITVSLFLQSWQIYDVSLLSGRYVSVGLCLLLFMAIAVLPFYYLFGSFYDSWFNKQIKTNLVAYVGAFVLSLVLSALFSLIIAVFLGTQLLPDDRTASSDQFASDMWMTVKFLSSQWRCLLEWHLPLCVVGALLASGARFGWRTKLEGVPNGIWLSALVAICLIIATKSYTASYFCTINQAYGGGIAYDIQLVIDADAVEAVRQLRIETDENSDPPLKEEGGKGLLGPAISQLSSLAGVSSKKTVKLQKTGLLDQNDKFYFLLITEANNNKRSAQVDKSIVKGVRILDVKPEIPQKDPNGQTPIVSK